MGSEWELTSNSSSAGSRMQIKSGVDPLLLSGSDYCLSHDLYIRECTTTINAWSWNPSTLQIQLSANGDIWCLGVSAAGDNEELQMTECFSNGGASNSDQGGRGAPAEQTWVLFPANRPQIAELVNIQFPLRSQGKHIVDTNGKVLKLAGVSWTGASTEMLVNNGLERVHIRQLAKVIKYMGFNSVRLSYASSFHHLSVTGTYPDVPNPAMLADNPQLQGLSALEVFDLCVEELTQEGILVIIQHGMMSPGWCCNGTDNNELWYGSSTGSSTGRTYTIDDWLSSLTFMADRYKQNPKVIGMEVFNAPRVRREDSDGTMSIPWWGISSSESADIPGLGFDMVDWRLAAAKGAVAVWKGHPDALVFVDGPIYSADLRYVLDRPLQFAQDCLLSRIVYAPREYRWFEPLYTWFNEVSNTFNPLFRSNLLSAISPSVDNRLQAAQGVPPADVYAGSYDDWVNLREPSVYYIQKGSPGRGAIWVGEFGTTRGGDYWNHMLRYYQENDINWCYWALDPIRYPPDFPAATVAGSDLTFGIFDTFRKDYWAVVGWKLQDLVGIMQPFADGTRERPVEVSAPEYCRFDEASNVAAVNQQTSPDLSETLRGMDWTPMAMFHLALLILLVLLLPCCCCIFCLCCRKREDDNNKPYEPLSEHVCEHCGHDRRGPGHNNKVIEAYYEEPRNDSSLCCGTGNKSKLNGRTIQRH